MARNETRSRLLTVEEYARLPDDGYRTSLVRGMVVREPQPAYHHGRLQAELLYHLRMFIDDSGVALECVGPVGSILARGPDTVRGPDVAVIRAERVPPANRVGFFEGAPDLAVEIVSPSNTRKEIQEKVTDYLAAGAQCVWVMDPVHRSVTVHRSGHEASTLREPEELMCDPVLPGFHLKLALLFGRA